MSARGEWEWTPAGMFRSGRLQIPDPVYRQPIAQPPEPPDPMDLVEVAVGPGEVRTMTRQAAAEHFAVAHGYLTAGGLATDSGVTRMLAASEHALHMSGAQWCGEEESAERLRLMRAAANAQQVMDQARSAAKGPADLTADRAADGFRLRQADAAGDRAMRGIA